MSGDERRMAYRVTSEWLGLKRQQPIPSIDFLHPNRFSVEWRKCVLIRLLDGPAAPLADNLEIEYVGNEYRDDMPGTVAGLCLSAVPKDTLLSLSAMALPKIFERRTAVIHAGQQPWRTGGAIYFQAIAVPFSDNGGVLRYGLGALGYKFEARPLSPEDARTEFQEYRDADWLPLSDGTPPDLIAAA